ncbi:MAG: hypothetical protein HUJ31_04530, partial [Pseudomonadales bacterium]|nr:hypothetical protein [Pseudomonadales bacterium]
NRTSLANNRINAITQDASGVLWLATHGGISSWNYFSDTFKYYSTAENYLQSDLVTSVAETSEGVLWVGTYGGGLSSIDPMTDTVTSYRYDQARPDSLPDDRVMALHVDDKNRVWVGTRNGGLALKDASGPGFKRFVHDPDDPRSLSGNAITSIFSDLRGALWVGVFDGGIKFSHAGDASSFEHFRHIPGDSSSLSGDRVLTIYQDHSGAIWLGTENAGLNRFDLASGKFSHFDLDGNSSDRDPHGTPWAIHESRDGTMWIGTLGQGLFRWSQADRDADRVNFEQFAVAQGLASEIYGIIESPGNKLWLSSNRGLFRFDMATREVRKFDHNNGLRTNEFNQGAAFRSRTGRMFFGGTAGLVGFFPGELPDNRRPPMVSVEARSRTETIARTGTGHATPMIRLNYFDAFVIFDFVALDFTSPDKNEYRYRLNGLDSEWTEVQGFRRAVYSSLSPGNYTFEVQASNNDGVWNRAGAEVEIYVVPPPWSTWWAYLVYGLIAVALVGWYLMNQRTKQLAEAATRARLEQLVMERTAELADRNTELTELNKRLEQASVTDALTGLHNRRFVDEHIASELSMLRRLRFEEKEEGVVNADSPRMLFLMMIDLDGFKA